MDYTRSSVVALFRGPILRTPQGRVLIALCAVYLVLAVIAFVFSDVAPPFLKLTAFAGWCAFMPVLLFLFYIKSNQPDFEPSIKEAGWSLVVGLIPIPLWLWHVYA